MDGQDVQTCQDSHMKVAQERAEENINGCVKNTRKHWPRTIVSYIISHEKKTGK